MSEPVLRFCPLCGAGLLEGARFCAVCGSQLPGSTAVVPVPSGPAAPEVAGRRGRRWWLWGLVGLVAVTAVAVVLVVILGGGDGLNDGLTTTTSWVAVEGTARAVLADGTELVGVRSETVPVAATASGVDAAVGVGPEFVFDGEVSGSPVTVVVPFDRSLVQVVDASEGPVVFVAVFDETAAVWVPLVSEVDWEAGLVSAEAPHLSLVQAQTWDLGVWGEVIGGFLRGLGMVFPAEPVCEIEAEGVLVVVGERSVVKGCAEDAGDGRLRVQVASQRAFGLLVDAPAGVRVEEQAFPSVRTALYNWLSQQVSEAEGYLPPVGTMSLLVDAGVVLPVTVSFEPSEATLVADALWTLCRASGFCEIPGIIEGVANCVFAAVNTLGDQTTVGDYFKAAGACSKNLIPGMGIVTGIVQGLQGATELAASFFIDLGKTLTVSHSDAAGTTTTSEAASTTTAVSSGWGTATVSHTPNTGWGFLNLTDVRVGDHAEFVRVVFDLTGAGDVWYVVGYGPCCPTREGEPPSVRGSAHLMVTMYASIVDFRVSPAVYTYTGEHVLEPGIDPIEQIALVDDFEGQGLWAIGLNGEQPFQVQVLGDPLRLVIDIAKSNPTPAELAPQLLDRGYWIDPGLSVSEQRISAAVARAGAAGVRFFVVLLDESPAGEVVAFADSVLDRIGYGSVLVLAGSSVGMASTAFDQATVERALDAGFAAGEDDVAVVEAVVVALIESASHAGSP